MRNGRIIALLFAAALANVLTACNAKGGNDEAGTNSTQVASEEKTDTVAMKAFVKALYDDILPLYNSGRELEVDEFEKYGSHDLQNLINEVDEWSSNHKDEAEVMGWDCNPWIFAQDWEHIDMKIVQAESLSPSKGRVDVIIKHGDDKRWWGQLTLFVVKEDGEYRVDDFIGTESYDYAPTFKEILAEDFEEVKKSVTEKAD